MKTGKNHSAWQGLLLNGALHENIVDMLSCPVGIEQLGKYFWRVSQVLNAPLQDMACGVLLARTTGAPEWNTCLQNFSHSERIEAKIDFPLKKQIRKSRKIRKRLPDFPIEQSPSLLPGEGCRLLWRKNGPMRKAALLRLSPSCQQKNRDIMALGALHTAQHTKHDKSALYSHLLRSPHFHLPKA